MVTRYDQIAGKLFGRVRGVLRETSGVKSLFTQEMMASRMGITQAWLSKIEHGHAGVSLEQFSHFCNALSLPWDDVRLFMETAMRLPISDTDRVVQLVIDTAYDRVGDTLGHYLKDETTDGLRLRGNVTRIA